MSLCAGGHEGPTFFVMGLDLNKGEDLSGGCDTGTNSADKWRPLCRVWSGWQIGSLSVCMCVYRIGYSLITESGPSLNLLLTPICFCNLLLLFGSYLLSFSLSHFIPPYSRPHLLSSSSLDSISLASRLPIICGQIREKKAPTDRKPKLIYKQWCPFPVLMEQSLYNMKGEGVTPWSLCCYLCNYRERPWSCPVSGCLPWSKNVVERTQETCPATTAMKNSRAH